MAVCGKVDHVESQFGNQRSPALLHFRFIILSPGRHSDCTITKICRSMTSHHEGAWKSNPWGGVAGQTSVDFCIYTQDHTISLWKGCGFDHHFWTLQISIVYSHCLFFPEQKCIASYIPLLLFA